MEKNAFHPFLGLAFLAVLVSSQANPRERYIIKIDRARGGEIAGAIASSGGKVSHAYRIVPDWIAIEVPEQALPGIRHMPGVVLIEKDVEVCAVGQTLPWGVDRIEADLVHPTIKGKGIPVSVIDTGIDLEHPDLSVAGNVTFVDGTLTGDDDNGHGTHCAGIIAALANDQGIVGVAPEASLYAVKVLGAGGQGYLSDIIAGINWSVDHGIRVVSMSLGNPSDFQSLHDACDAAYNSGVLLVAAAGNSGNAAGDGDNMLYPAKYSSVIAVGATDSNNQRATFSSTGSSLEIAAPGVDIYSTVPGGYGTISGTSSACPHVAGSAALVFAAGAGSNTEVRRILQNAASDLGTTGWDNWYGYGLVDANVAVQSTELTPLQMVTNSLSDATVDWPYDQILEATGGTIPYQWGISGGALPPGLSLNPFTGVISGTVSAAGTWSFAVELTDNTIPVAGKSSRNFSIAVGNLAANLMSVDSITFSSKKAGLGQSLNATVNVVDNAGMPLSGVYAAMALTGVGSYTFSGRTKVDGSVTFVVKKANPGMYTATVKSLSHKSYTWNPYCSKTTASCMLNADGSLDIQNLAGSSASGLMNETIASYPNPFNPETRIRYKVEEAGFVSLKVYSILGHVVRVLISDSKDAGVHSVVWDGKDDQGIPLPSGMYVGRLVAGKQSAIQTMFLLR